jgi:DNA polymerase V
LIVWFFIVVSLTTRQQSGALADPSGYPTCLRRTLAYTVIMNSIPASALLAAIEREPLALPMVCVSIQAGFPSPADDHALKRHDLNDLLITHPLATFFWRVAGRSMAEAGIDDGDILVVNRALTPLHRHIVVAQVDGEFTVKFLHKRQGRVKLVPANATFPEISFKDGQTLTIVGVVTCAIKRFVP